MVTNSWVSAVPTPSRHSLERLLGEIRGLRAAALDQEARLSDELSQLHPNFCRGGRNFAHYLAVRQQDLRPLQRDLARLGLSSLGRMEACVLPTLESVERDLEILAAASDGRAWCSGRGAGSGESAIVRIDLDVPEAELARNTATLLGPASAGQKTRIMVTLPLDASSSMLEELVAGGTSVVRINCAKGDAGSWTDVVQRVRAVERKLGKSCHVLCDLAGPNPRSCGFEGGRDGKHLARVSAGNRLFVARDRAARERAMKRDEKTAVIGFTMPEVIGDLRVGERVFYDDSSLVGVVREVDVDGALVEVTFARKPRLKIKAEKTLNFPDTDLSLPSLTAQDLKDLDFVARDADMVGFSFVRSPSDIELLQRELRARTDREIGIVLKIETNQAFNQLPRLLLTAMRSPRVGVMVARGDMAVELGFERLAEAQEEVLWLCEAALVPAIWATQVLESLNKNGVPSRAEVTDAAMSGRAECVMLNRGEHVVETLSFLSKVLERMQAHQEKKRSMLRKLRVSVLE